MVHPLFKPLLVLAIICPLILVGCGSSATPIKTYKVTGKVTFKGKPVSKGSVIFSSTNPEMPAATGPLDDQGGYVLTTTESGDGAAAGEYVVAVRSFDDAGPPNELALKMPKALVPVEFVSLETTPIRKTVKAEELNTIDIEIP